MHAQQQQLINGAWVTGDAEPLSKHDPVSGKSLWQAATASSEQVTAAVKAARGAFPGWARTPFAERQALVERFAEVLKHVVKTWPWRLPLKPASRCGKRAQKRVRWWVK